MASKYSPLPEGSTLGIIGGGQLGSFFLMAARKLGFKVAVLCPDKHAPAIRAADYPIIAQYNNQEALHSFATKCDAITIEFENIPVTSLEFLSKHTRVTPDSQALNVSQNRIVEKDFFKGLNLPVTPYCALENETDWQQLQNSEESKNLFPGILKTASSGYDGKGQWNIENIGDEAINIAYDKWLLQDSQPLILEKRQGLNCEFSLIVVSSSGGEISFYPVVLNRHNQGILDISVVPAPKSEWLNADIQNLAQEYADLIIKKLGYIGVMGIEFFVTESGILVNEIAPRPHNSGHFSLDASYCSQFEQQVRILAGWPIGSTKCHSKAVMVNLLGDIWPNLPSKYTKSTKSTESAQSTKPTNNTIPNSPDWSKLLEVEGLFLHIYGKKEAKAGRKMGHFTIIGSSTNALLKRASNSRKVIKANA